MIAAYGGNSGGTHCGQSPYWNTVHLGTGYTLSSNNGAARQGLLPCSNLVLTVSVPVSPEWSKCPVPTWTTWSSWEACCPTRPSSSSVSTEASSPTRSLRLSARWVELFFYFFTLAEKSSGLHGYFRSVAHDISFNTPTITAWLTV